MASGSINKELKIKHMTYTATISSVGRIVIPSDVLNPAKSIILRAYIQGTSYWVPTYNYMDSSAGVFLNNVIVMNSETGSRITNTSVTLQIDYIEL